MGDSTDGANGPGIVTGNCALREGREPSHAHRRRIGQSSQACKHGARWRRARSRRGGAAGHQVASQPPLVRGRRRRAYCLAATHDTHGARQACSAVRAAAHVDLIRPPVTAACLVAHILRILKEWTTESRRSWRMRKQPALLAMALCVGSPVAAGGAFDGQLRVDSEPRQAGGRRACLSLAQQYCASPGLSLCGSNVCGTSDCVALRDGGANSAAKQWRCYSKRCLTPDHLHYKNGTGAHYCTRDAAISEILQTCKLPSAPPPAPGWPGFASGAVYAAEVFTPGEGGYPCIRIPSVALSGDNITLNAFAECRNYTGDGCFPLRVPSSAEGAVKDICQKQSTDSGKVRLGYACFYG